MSYNSKAIKTDVNAKPIPQYYNPATDEYEVLQGSDGAARQVLYGPDGNPISTADGKLAVKASELEVLLTALKGKDFATETKLEAVRVLLNSLAGEDFATSAKQAEMLAALGKQSTAEKQDTLVALVGAIDAAAVSDPAASGAVIALLKGVLERLQTVEGKIDGITDGTTPATTQLTGSNVAVEEYILADRAERRTVGAVYYPGISYAKALDVSHLGAKNIKIENMHNQELIVDLYSFSSGVGTFGSIEPKIENIAAGTKKTLWSKDHPWLNEPIAKMSVYTAYNNAPTEGYLSIVMVGEPRC